MKISGPKYHIGQLVSEFSVYKPCQYLQKLGLFVSASVVIFFFLLFPSPSPKSSVYIISKKKEKKEKKKSPYISVHYYSLNFK